MKIRTSAALFLTAGVAACLPTIAMAVDFPEIEPNETKAQALTNGAFTLVAGDTFTGNTTGTSLTVAGAASADTYLVKTGPLPLGSIYRHRLAITTAGTAGHIGTIRGLGSTSTGATLGGDVTFQTSNTTNPIRTNQWYGFGKEEQLYYRVTGTTATTIAYVSTLSTTTVVPAAVSGSIEAGTVTILHNAATNAAFDRDMFLFDSNFNPIAGIDDDDSTALSVTLSTGTYYVGYGRWQTAAGPFAGNTNIQGPYQTGAVLDFADGAVSGVPTVSTTPVVLNFTSPAGPATGNGAALGAYDIAWFSFTVQPPLTSTNPTGVGSAIPSSVANDGTGVTVLRVTVTPGATPTSTGLGVSVTSSALVGGTVTLLDNGSAPDVLAGDNIFSANATVVNGTPGGVLALPFAITDAQARNGAGNIALTVTTPPPACPAGLATLTFNNVSSNNAVGGLGNSIVSGNFGVAGLINTINISGRVQAFGGSFRSEARIRATSPDGSTFDIGSTFGLPASLGTSDIATFTFNLPTTESGTGTWGFEFFESLADSDTPDATWQQICFGVDAVSSNPTATDISTPAAIVRDGVAATNLFVTVGLGLLPTSTGVAVTVNDSSVGGTGTLVLLDDGNAPDVLAGDSIFSASTTAARTTALGTATLPYTVTDAQGRNAGAALSLNFTVNEASGACCVADVCTISTINNCIDVLLGTFAGTGTQCFAPPAFTTDGAGAFENIAGTGTVLAAVTGDDVIGTVAIPFAFNFYGTAYTSANVSTNGNIQFPASNSTAFTNGPIPSAAIPNNALYVLWDDLNVTAGGQVFTELLGTIGTDARFIIQWNIVRQFGGTDSSTFQIALFEDGNFEYRYLSVSAETVLTDTTTIGSENSTGTIAGVLNQTRAQLAAAAPISYRSNSTLADTGICIPTCPACPADYNQDGGVTGDDIAAFFADFEDGASCADTNVDGGITGDDIAAFFSAYEAGGC